MLKGLKRVTNSSATRGPLCPGQGGRSPNFLNSCRDFGVGWHGTAPGMVCTLLKPKEQKKKKKMEISTDSNIHPD